MYDLKFYNHELEKTCMSKLQTLAGAEIFTPGLERIKKFASENILPDKTKIITVGGTNGKGEVSRSITKILEKEGKSVALFTSPHILSVLERFYFKGRLISYGDFLDYLSAVSSWQEKENIKFSYFEILFSIFILWAKKITPDFIVLEVGLGGRLDATNCLDLDYAVLTSIGRDHQEILGTSYKKILHEKLGIIREGKFLFTQFDLDYLNQELERKIKGSKIVWERFKEGHELSFTLKNRFFARFIVSKILDKAEVYSIGEKEPIHPILGNKEFGGVDFSFYGSHNPEALRKLVLFLSPLSYNNQKFDFIFFSLSKRSEKDLKAVVELIMQIPSKRRIFVPIQHHKGIELQNVDLNLEEKNIEVFSELPEDLLQSFKASDKVLVTGSNYFIGEFFSKYFASK